MTLPPPGATPAPPPPPRSRILATARRDLETGQPARGARALAAAAGVATSTLYEHFPSRDAVYVAVAVADATDEAAREREALRGQEAASLSTYLEALVFHRAARMVARAELVHGLLASPTTRTRASHRAALHDPSLAALVRAFERRRWELHPELAPADAAELVAVGIRGALLGALEERPQYLDDPAFLAELTALLDHAVARAPRRAHRWQARSHAHAFHRRPAAGAALRKQPAQARSRALVEAVVDATERVVERRGVGAVTTPRVAEVTGVSVGSLYQYFGNRTSLLGALVDRWMQRDLQFVEREVESRAGLSARNFLDGLVDATHERWRGFARVYRGLFVVLGRLERTAAARDFLALSRAIVADALVRRPDTAGIDCELMIFVQGHALVAWWRALTMERPALVADPRLPAMMRRIGRGSLDRVA